MKTNTAIAVLAVFVLVLIGGWWFLGNKAATNTPGGNATSTPIATAAFACAEGKSIGAAFFNNPNAVALQLSDGRALQLAQATSASGIRYANADESFVFWGKGNTAFITEGADQTQTYTGCIVVAPDSTQTLTQIYASSTLGLTIRFPQNYTADQKYVYQALGPGKDIHGVKFTIPAAATTGTNLSKDTYISVEELPKATSCSADLFVDTQGSKKATTFTDNGVQYSIATTSGAAAGNLYNEAVFALPDSSPCTAVRYFIHSGNIGNYPAGTVTQFNQAGLLAEFDNIRRSLVLGR